MRTVKQLIYLYFTVSSARFDACSIAWCSYGVNEVPKRLKHIPNLFVTFCS